MNLQNIYSQLSSTDRIEMINRQKSILRERRFPKEFSEKREDKKKKKKRYSLLPTEDTNDLVEISGKKYGNKRDVKNMDSSRFQNKDNGEVIDVKV